MAQRGKPIPARLIQQIQASVARQPIRATARQLDVDRKTVRKYTRPRGA